MESDSHPNTEFLRRHEQVHPAVGSGSRSQYSSLAQWEESRRIYWRRDQLTVPKLFVPVIYTYLVKGLRSSNVLRIRATCGLRMPRDDVLLSGEPGRTAYESSREARSRYYGNKQSSVIPFLRRYFGGVEETSLTAAACKLWWIFTHVYFDRLCSTMTATSWEIVFAVLADDPVMNLCYLDLIPPIVTGTLLEASMMHLKQFDNRQTTLLQEYTRRVFGQDRDRWVPHPSIAAQSMARTVRSLPLTEPFAHRLVPKTGKTNLTYSNRQSQGKGWQQEVQDKNALEVRAIRRTATMLTERFRNDPSFLPLLALAIKSTLFHGIIQCVREEVLGDESAGEYEASVLAKIESIACAVLSDDLIEAVVTQFAVASAEEGTAEEFTKKQFGLDTEAMSELRCNVSEQIKTLIAKLDEPDSELEKNFVRPKQVPCSVPTHAPKNIV